MFDLIIISSSDLALINNKKVRYAICLSVCLSISHVGKDFIRSETLLTFKFCIIFQVFPFCIWSHSGVDIALDSESKGRGFESHCDHYPFFLFLIYPFDSSVVVTVLKINLKDSSHYSITLKEAWRRKYTYLLQLIYKQTGGKKKTYL